MRGMSHTLTVAVLLVDSWTSLLWVHGVICVLSGPISSTEVPMLSSLSWSVGKSKPLKEHRGERWFRSKTPKMLRSRHGAELVKSKFAEAKGMIEMQKQPLLIWFKKKFLQSCHPQLSWLFLLVSNTKKTILLGGGTLGIPCISPWARPQNFGHQYHMRGKTLKVVFGKVYIHKVGKCVIAFLQLYLFINFALFYMLAYVRHLISVITSFWCYPGNFSDFS